MMDLDFDVLNGLVMSMSVMRFFPKAKEARLALVMTLGEMCSSEDQARWLVKRVRQMYSDWPGEREMRACFCARYRPKDGVNAGSTVYPDGLPRELPESNPVKLLPLPVGAIVSADADLERSVVALAQAKDMRNAGRRRCHVPGVPEVSNLPPEKRITLADVERAVNELHEKRASVELSGGD
jgi:hypothetical protein